MFTDVGFHLKSGFKKLLYSQMLVFTLNLDSQKYCVHQFFLYIYISMYFFNTTFSTIHRYLPLLSTTQYQIYYFAFPSTFKHLLALFSTIQHYSALFSTNFTILHFLALSNNFQLYSSLFITIQYQFNYFAFPSTFK